MQPHDDLMAYADRISVVPDEALSLMVSTGHREFALKMVRLIHGDDNAEGPGLIEEEIPFEGAGVYAGVRQTTHPGSFAYGRASLVPERGVSFVTWIWPTLLEGRRTQGIMTYGSEGDALSVSIILDEAGYLVASLKSPTGDGYQARASSPCVARAWYFVALTFEPRAGALKLYSGHAAFGHPALRESAITANVGEWLLAVAGSVVVGAEGATATGAIVEGSSCFNGKIDDPRIFNGCLTNSEVTALSEDSDEFEFDRVPLAARWAFDADPASTFVRSAVDGGHELSLVNTPKRIVTSHAWQGQEYEPSAAVNLAFRALYFHDDDLADAGWSPTLTATVPRVPSGVYAFKLKTPDEETYVPFVVRPPSDGPHERILVLLPTLTYLAYANEALYLLRDYEGDGISRRRLRLTVFDDLRIRHPEFGGSIYDRHRDGSGRCFSSLHRPIFNIDPRYRHYLLHAPRHFAADLYLINWLEMGNYRYDVITDHDLDSLGIEALVGYDVVVTGSHPEYVTAVELDALQSFLSTGGKVMYLGGNGLHWVTSTDPSGSLMESRREALMGPWWSQPGEVYQATTGERGGLWSMRGRPTESWFGVGTCAISIEERCPGYVRTKASHDPEVASIFEGVDEEVIGDFGFVMGGAAGDELDCADVARGTSPTVRVLASSRGLHDSSVRPAGARELWASRDNDGNLGADLVYVDNESGGAVFAVGSINWMGSLGVNGGENNVSKVTENVLRQFLTRTNQ